MRKAQWGGFNAKKAAFQVRKYDTAVAKGNMPKLRDHHPQLLECTAVCVDLSDYLGNQAKEAVMRMMRGLVGAGMLPRPDAPTELLEQALEAEAKEA